MVKDDCSTEAPLSLHLLQPRVVKLLQVHLDAKANSAKHVSFGAFRKRHEITTDTDSHIEKPVPAQHNFFDEMFGESDVRWLQQTKILHSAI
ncbi:MAG: hypothetical protein ABI155_14815 [Paralcaligenes sp.]